VGRKYRNFTLIILLCVLALATGLGAAPLAGGQVVYVDNPNVPNGSVNCPSTPYLTIETGLAAFNGDTSNVTLYVCPGVYDGFGGFGYEIGGYTNLKIIGRGNPTIQAIPSFVSSMFAVVDSSNVTIEGLTIDGHGHLGTSATSAIVFQNSYGTIKGNTITAWHQPYVGTPPFNVGPNPAHSINVSSVPSGKSVKVQNNTIYDSQDTGILVYNSSAVEVSNNRVVFGSAIVPYGVGSVAPVQAGIALVQTNPGITVSNNQVISDADLFPQAHNYARGIMLLGTIGARVTNNTVRGTAAQITIETWCDWYGAVASNNIVSGNKLYDTISVGVYITARDDASTFCGTTPHADFNQVKQNTIYTLDRNVADNPFGLFGVLLETRGTGVIGSNTVTNNTIAGFGLDSVNTGGTGAVPDLVWEPNKILTLPPAGVYK
jgi:parallel beta-helix repeat protein